MMQAQQTKTEQSLLRQLELALASSELKSADALLAQPNGVSGLQKLARLRTTYCMRSRWTRLVGNTVVGFLLMMVITGLLPNTKLTESPVLWIVGFVIWPLALWRTTLVRSYKQLVDNISLLLPSYLKQADRSELGTLLELAPELLKNHLLANQVRDLLARLLARTPIDELSLLTPLQRENLRTITLLSIEEARYNSFHENLAIAGLLALESLKDASLRTRVYQLFHPSGRVRDAVHEYLVGIAV